ncbi:A designed selected ankyrin repeat protein in complex with the Map kinase Erk2, partial [Baffinella frigidus]
TSLMAAIDQGHAEAAQLLIQNGASVHYKDDNGEGLLHQAAFGYAPFEDGVVGVARVLLQNGVDIEARCPSGRTALHIAASGKAALVRLLLQYGADVTATTLRGLTPLHWAAFHGSDLEVVQMLLENKSNVLARTQMGNTAACLSKLQGHRALTRII